MIDGQSATIPANIGIDSSLWQDHSLDQYSSMPDMPDGMSGMAPLHTHDTSGRIHVESRVSREYTLGEFFRIWGQTFDAQQVLGHQAQTGHRVWMVVDGSTMSPRIQSSSGTRWQFKSYALPDNRLPERRFGKE